MLTQRQAEAYGFIRGSIRNGVNPSFDDVASALGTKSRGRVHHILACLAERGFITRKRGANRGICLTHPIVFRFDDETKQLVEVRR